MLSKDYFESHLVWTMTSRFPGSSSRDYEVLVFFYGVILAEEDSCYLNDCYMELFALLSVMPILWSFWVRASQSGINPGSIEDLLSSVKAAKDTEFISVIDDFVGRLTGNSSWINDWKKSLGHEFVSSSWP